MATITTKYLGVVSGANYVVLINNHIKIEQLKDLNYS